jgi:hypothetical protein
MMEAAGGQMACVWTAVAGDVQQGAEVGSEATCRPVCQGTLGSRGQCGVLAALRWQSLLLAHLEGNFSFRVWGSGER